MTKKKVIIGGISLFIVILVVVSLLVFKDFRNGLVSTVQGTINSTLVSFGLKEDTKIPEQPTDQVDEQIDQQGTDETSDNTGSTEQPIVSNRKKDNLEVHIPNIRGDLIVFREGREAVIINSGVVSDQSYVKSYLKKIGVKRVRYVIVQNYLHASLGGFLPLMKNIEPDFIFLSQNVANRKYDKGVTDYLDKNNLVWAIPKEDVNFKIGKSKFEIFNTHNGGSLVIVVTNGNNKLMFTGATTKFDKPLLAKLPTYVDLHSVTASNSEYKYPTHVQDRANPHTVILNDHKGVNVTNPIKQIFSQDVTLYRSTTCGDIVIGSNGEDLIYSCDKPEDNNN